MFKNSINNSYKFRFVGATAKQSDMYKFQLPTKNEESAFTIPADPKTKSLNKGSLIGSLR